MTAHGISPRNFTTVSLNMNIVCLLNSLIALLAEFTHHDPSAERA